jgi:fatty acid elongase 3
LIATLAAPFGYDETWINNFEFKVGETAGSHIQFPVLAIIMYCAGIPLLQRFMQNRKDPPLKWILVVHNLFLSVMSAIVAFLIILELIHFRQSGYDYFRIFCLFNYHEQVGRLTLLYYINYLLKYYEFVDTIFLALKHKPIGFLHAYHHPATLVLTWGQIVDASGAQWFVILLNLFVHTVMYFYYGMAALKINIPWKRVVTVMQILQFVADLFACYYGWGLMRLRQQCFGTHRAGIVGLFILTSYLYLFIDFYDATYHQKPSVVKKTV